MNNCISSFSGDYRFLSNFWGCKLHIPTIIGEVKFQTVEHAYQAFKTLDPDKFQQVAQSATPGIAKRMGQKLDLREDWEEIKIRIMTNLVTQKFKQNPELMSLLLLTKGLDLIEANTWGDTFWGQCPLGNGKNHLGKILMSIRDDIFNIKE